MEVKDIRLANLLALAGGYKRIGEFCEKIEISPSYFSQVKAGKKAIGDEIARRVELSLGLPRGYMDTQKTPQAGSGIPSETLSLAFAIDALPKNIRDSLSRLIYNVAAMSKDIPDFEGKVIHPFNTTVSLKNGENTAVQTSEPENPGSVRHTGGAQDR